MIALVACSKAKLQALIERRSKRCPQCKSNMVTSHGMSEELYHTCIECGHKFPDSEALPPAQEDPDDT